MKRSRGTWRGLLACIALACVGHAAWGQVHAENLVEPCARTNSFAVPAAAGPFDFRTISPGFISMTEANHFTPNIENLEHGNTGTLAEELSFLLHAMPNFPRGLAALTRYSLREHSTQPGNLDFSVDCYYLRAIRFRPNDLIVRMLFADYLIKWNRIPEAAAQLDAVRGADTDNPMTHYNLGLLYFEIKRYKDALEQAHIAMALGMERDDLKKKLVAVGQWTDPAPPEAAASAASATSAPTPAASTAAASAVASASAAQP
ncbi:MAG: hypothetical protein KGI36_01170 [Burkholderiales bacterium]|nr:hypothetical protein [Burkholderiales bacterium]